MQEIEIIDNRKVLKSFQSYLGNSNNKINLVKYVFRKWRETLPYVLISSQTIYLGNFDGATDRVASQGSERIYFYCDHEEAHISSVFVIIFVWTGSSYFRQTDATVISL